MNFVNEIYEFCSIHSSVTKMYSSHLKSMELWSNVTNKCLIKTVFWLSFGFIIHIVKYSWSKW